MLKGTLIGESVRLGASLEGLPLRVEKIYRLESGDPTAGQPLAWTFVEFQAPDDAADALAAALSHALDPAHGWYCDFRTEDETFVVFAEKIFRYARADRAARAAVEAHGRSVGVPEAQLDWPA